MSGFPFKVESVRELDQKPSNSFLLPSLFFKKVFSAINADNGLCVSIILQNFPESHHPF